MKLEVGSGKLEVGNIISKKVLVFKPTLLLWILSETRSRVWF